MGVLHYVETGQKYVMAYAGRDLYGRFVNWQWAEAPAKNLTFGIIYSS